MQGIKQISAIILGVIFLISSSGFMIYKTHCYCTGNQQVSVFVQNEICEMYGPNSCCGETTESCCISKEILESEPHASDCDCNKPEVIYFKLTNVMVKEEVKFTKSEPIQLVVAHALIQFNLWETDNKLVSHYTYIDPPLIHVSALKFLIHIQQLKIPSLV